MDEVVSHVMGRDKVKTIMDCFHEEGMLKGRLEGLQAGKLEGLREGELKGLQEGERKALQNVALSLVSEGMDTDQVARLTGLKASDVMDLKQSHSDSLMC
jgi:predicted transposase YdaD